MISEYRNKPVRLYLTNGEVKSGIVKVFDAVNEDMFYIVESVMAFSKKSLKLDLVNVPSVEEIELLEYPGYEIE